MALTKPLGYYTDESALRFHVLDVGEGLMVLVIFPNEQVMLFDCNVTDDNEDEILNYLSVHIPYRNNASTGAQEQIIDVFVNSHRDEDHYRGLKKVNNRFPIQSIWDSGQTGAATQRDDYAYYMSLRRRLRDKNPDNLKVLIPTDIPVAYFEGVEIFCLSDKEEYQSSFDNGKTVFCAKAKIQHTNCIVLKISYGGRSILLTGDSDWKCWKNKIVPNFGSLLHSEILVASHHGSRSFFTDEANDTIDEEKNPDSTYLESIELISPDVTLISCGKYETHHHPNEEAKALYEKHSKHCQVFSTVDLGHLSGYIASDGSYTVVPAHFFESRTASNSFNARIECTYSLGGESKSVSSGSTLTVGGNLKFWLKTSGGIIDPIEKVNVIWEVSNGGINQDSSHQEIYRKRRTEPGGPFSFSRKLEYYGTHLLMCKITHRTKGAITRIFRITGV